LSVHGEIARRPNCRSSDIGREHRVGGRLLANDPSLAKSASDLVNRST
jgi:hypothetical protein